MGSVPFYPKPLCGDQKDAEHPCLLVSDCPPLAAEYL